VKLEAVQKTPAQSKAEPKKEGAETAADKTDGKSADVVSLDAFRKK
jgi:hypothetical protein